MATVEEGLRAQVRNIEASSGRPMSAWTTLIGERGLTRHGEIVAWLKAEHGMTHGNANRVAMIALAGGDATPTTDDAVDQLYGGKRASLRSIHDRILEVVTGFGSDVEVAPKKGYLSLRRRKQFAMLQPAARHVDLGLILPGEPANGRLAAGGSFNAMFSHRVRLTSPDEVDPQVVGWLRAAYEAAR